MASSGGIKGFYKQKKKNGGGVSKPSPSSRKKQPGKCATLGSGDPPQTTALIAHGSYDLYNEYDEEEVKLRQFDMDMKYGPCVGITRLERWQRADSMGISPPKEIEQLLLRYATESSSSSSNDNKQRLLECLWEGRV